MQLEGDLRSSGSMDIAGLVNGNVFVNEITIIKVIKKFKIFIVVSLTIFFLKIYIY